MTSSWSRDSKLAETDNLDLETAKNMVLCSHPNEKFLEEVQFQGSSLKVRRFSEE